MIQTLEAIIDANGNIKLQDEIKLDKAHRALVTILDEEPAEGDHDTALLSESSLSEDWNSPEEDKAWQHLDSLPSC